MSAQHTPGPCDQLTTAANLARRVRLYRSYARVFRSGGTVYGYTKRGCEREARNLEEIVRSMADAAVTGSAA